MRNLQISTMRVPLLTVFTLLFTSGVYCQVDDCLTEFKSKHDEFQKCFSIDIMKKFTDQALLRGDIRNVICTLNVSNCLDIFKTMIEKCVGEDVVEEEFIELEKAVEAPKDYACSKSKEDFQDLFNRAFKCFNNPTVKQTSANCIQKLLKTQVQAITIKAKKRKAKTMKGKKKMLESQIMTVLDKAGNVSCRDMGQGGVCFIEAFAKCNDPIFSNFIRNLLNRFTKKTTCMQLIEKEFPQLSVSSEKFVGTISVGKTVENVDKKTKPVRAKPKGNSATVPLLDLNLLITAVFFYYFF